MNSTSKEGGESKIFRHCVVREGVGLGGSKCLFLKKHITLVILFYFILFFFGGGGGSPDLPHLSMDTKFRNQENR